MAGNFTKFFIFSGVSQTERKELTKKATRLGAKCLDLKDFKAYCTHVITDRLTKSEKVLGGIATGKWILHPDYINDSVSAGCWLDEEQYEFCDMGMMRKYPGVDRTLLEAPRRWRFQLGNNASAFAGWKVAVVAGAKKSSVIKRLLISGGADVYNLKLPVSHPERVADTIAYIFVSEQNVGTVSVLFEYGVLCLRPEYIGDFLIQDPEPDVMNYIVQIHSEPHQDDSFLDATQLGSSQSTNVTDDLSTMSTPTSPMVNHDLVQTGRLSNSRQITKQYSSVKKEQSTPVTIVKNDELIDVIDLTELDSTSESMEPSQGSRKYNEKGKGKQWNIVVDLTEETSQNVTISSERKKKSPFLKNVIPKLKMSDNFVETPMEADLEDANWPVSGPQPSTNGKSPLVAQVTSPITRFFKPVPDRQVEEKYDIKEEVQKALATSSPFVKKARIMNEPKTFTNNGEQSKDTRPILKARKRLTKTDSANRASPLTVQASGDNLRNSTKAEHFTANKAVNSIVTTSYNEKKRKIGMPDLEIGKRKVFVSEWTLLTHSLHIQDQGTEESRCLSMATTEVIQSMLEEEFTLSALSEIDSRVSTRYMPQVKTLKTLLFQVLENAQNKTISQFSYSILMKVLRLHPPLTESLQDLYMNVLSPESGDATLIGSEWSYILHLFYSVMHEQDAQKKQNWQFILAVIKNIIHLNAQQFICCREPLGPKPLITKIMWCPSYHVGFNGRCKQLLDAMMEAFTMYRTERDREKKRALYELVETITWFVSLTVETCRLSECGATARGVHCLNAKETALFIHEISKRLIDADISEPNLLCTLMSMFQLPWFCVGICQQILDTLDNYLVLDEQALDLRIITLSYTVRRYLFLLPRFHCDFDREKTFAHSLRQKKKEPLKCISQNTKKTNQPDSEKLLKKANKRNPKGETELHIACIRNNVTVVKRLLKIPGIDVNMQDNAGWTPLHEACNHGHIECVQELLRFVPSKTVDLYFTEGINVSKKVDLLAGNNERITPLHDAVLNNRVEVCRVLLQHGGPRLLKAETCLGYTALQLAGTDEMYHVLNSALPHKPRLTDSLDMSSLGSQGSTSSMDDDRLELPSDILYNEVLYIEGKRIYSHKNSVLQYLHLVNLLVNNYLKATDLLRLSKDGKQDNETVTLKVDQKIRNSQSDTAGTSVGSNSKSGYLQGIKSDLKTLKKLPYYIELFKTHLCRLCLPEDGDFIRTECLPLEMLGDSDCTKTECLPLDMLGDSVQPT